MSSTNDVTIFNVNADEPGVDDLTFRMSGAKARAISSSVATNQLASPETVTLTGASSSAQSGVGTVTVTSQPSQIVAPEHVKNISTTSGLPVSSIFHPGYYVGAANATYTIPTSVLNGANWSGALIKPKWRDMEPGFNSYNFDTLTSYYNTLEAAGKYLMIRLGGVSFTTKTPQTPSYMDNSSAYGGGIDRSTGLGVDEDGVDIQNGNYNRTVQGGGRSWALDEPAVVNRFILLLNALADWASTRPNVEAIIMGESALGYNVSGIQLDLSNGWRTLLSAAKDIFHPIGIQVFQTINFATYWRETNGSATGTAGMLEYCKDSNISLTFPDLREPDTSLEDNIYPFHLANHDIIASGAEVQFADYYNTGTTIRNANKDVPGIRDFGESAVNMHYFTWFIREPWFSGSPTLPVPGPNVVDTVAVRRINAAQEFYDSI